jgi:hypothetical protein
LSHARDQPLIRFLAHHQRGRHDRALPPLNRLKPIPLRRYQAFALPNLGRAPFPTKAGFVSLPVVSLKPVSESGPRPTLVQSQPQFALVADVR